MNMSAVGVNGDDKSVSAFSKCTVNANSKNHTVMSNHHLRNAALSLKAKGLLSQILSLPENWDYTLAGLSRINRESVDAIRGAVHELERAGYVTRSRERKENGQLGGAEYVIHEQPAGNFMPGGSALPVSAPPTQEKPMPGNPTQATSALGKPAQLNKDKALSNKEKTNTDLSNIHQSIYPATPEQDGGKEPPDGGTDRIDRIDRYGAMEAYREVIKDNIEYDALCADHDPERVGEILELILETVCTPRKTVRIGGEDFPAGVVKSRFMKLGQFHVEYVFECISKNTTKIRNIKAYLLTTLYNAPVTMGHYYTAEVNHDMYGGGL